MKVRDKTRKKTEYKGRLTDACDAACPCRPCYNAHDCGYMNSQGQHVVNMECATRWNGGCPSPMPEPEHIITSPRGRKCKRCGAWAKKDVPELEQERENAAAEIAALFSAEKAEMVLADAEDYADERETARAMRRL